MSIRKVCRKSFRYNAMSHTYRVCFFFAFIFTHRNFLFSFSNEQRCCKEVKKILSYILSASNNSLKNNNSKWKEKF